MSFAFSGEDPSYADEVLRPVSVLSRRVTRSASLAGTKAAKDAIEAGSAVTTTARAYVLVAAMGVLATVDLTAQLTADVASGPFINVHEQGESGLDESNLFTDRDAQWDRALQLLRESGHDPQAILAAASRTVSERRVSNELDPLWFERDEV